MAWYLNPALTSWREAVSDAYQNRAKHSDGTIGDARHRKSPSEHNPDRDGTVDAWDMDVNLLASSDADGNSAEDAAIEKLKLEFQKQPWAQLWIHNGWIANRDIGNWRRRRYTGGNSHSMHVHWQSRQSKERMEYIGGLTENETIVDAPNMIPVVRKRRKPKAPKWPIAKNRHFRPYLRTRPPFYATVYRWQQQMRKRGWTIDVDGRFGPQTRKVMIAFQREKDLTPDGLLGPRTWTKAFTAPIT